MSSSPTISTATATGAPAGGRTRDEATNERSEKLNDILSGAGVSERDLPTVRAALANPDTIYWDYTVNWINDSNSFTVLDGLLMSVAVESESQERKSRGLQLTSVEYTTLLTELLRQGYDLTMPSVNGVGLHPCFRILMSRGAEAHVRRFTLDLLTLLLQFTGSNQRAKKLARMKPYDGDWHETRVADLWKKFNASDLPDASARELFAQAQKLVTAAANGEMSALQLPGRPAWTWLQPTDPLEPIVSVSEAAEYLDQEDEKSEEEDDE